MPLRRSLRLREHYGNDQVSSNSVEVAPSNPSQESTEAPEQDPFATIDATPINQDGEGLDCQLHTYEVRTNSKGDKISLQIGSTDEFPKERERSRSHTAAMVLRRIYNYERDLKATQLEIRSPYLKKAIRDVVGCYPGVNLNSNANIFLSEDPRMLFHYRAELQTYAETCEDEEVKQHVRFCLGYMERFFKREIASFTHMMSNDVACPGLEFANLWMAFRPGDILYQKSRGDESLVRMVSMTSIVEVSKASGATRRSWCVETQRLQWKRGELGFVKRCTDIYHYDGHKSLSSMRIFPLRYHRDAERLKEEAIKRGRKYVSLMGVHHQQYEGNADVLDFGEYASLSVTGRILVDQEEFNKNVVPTYTSFMAEERLFHPEMDGSLDLTISELMICHHRIPGFSLQHKNWGIFDVDKIQEVEYNNDAFNDLAMPQQKKDMMASLLKSHANKALQIDDVIKGKGKGLVFLLHGPPGVGKTLTAESVADCYQRPLYVLGAGDLGGFGARVEKKLNQAMRLAVRWDAALLIDEADIFMEERKENEILRNELVSVLLRCVEYYQGVMFLTTNRMGSIDPAFKSRIHLALSFPPLCIDYRKRLWERFLVNATGGRPKFLTAKYMDKIAKENINGRQIKNIVRLSFALATSANRQLRSNDVDESLQSLKSFEKDFEDAQNDKKRAAEFESQRNPKRVKKQFFGLV